MSFKLVAFDLDGTLMPRFRSIRPAVAAAVRATEAAGVHVTIASGRRFAMLLPFAQQLGMTTPLIAHHGAFVKSPVDGRVLFHHGVPLPLAREVIALARQRDLAVVAFIGDDPYADQLKPEWSVFPWLVKIQAQDVGDLSRYLRADPTRLAIVTAEEQTKQLMIELREHFAGCLHVTSGHPLLTEISHPGVSKASGLQAVAEYLGVDRTEVLAAGDDWNDIEMLRYAGLGVAVADAPPEVLAAADVIVPTAEDDGAVEILRRFVLNQKPATD